ncbi:MAG: DEAD/DEAH box helicase family protein [Thermoguttaceae bacterium]|nr:DEAD/DEAH box helicase family protein [Thermoguttaceae bacterium]
MRIQYKHQKFQADAARAVVDVFAGQPYLTPTYMMDRGFGQMGVFDDQDYTGWNNHRIVPGLTDQRILENLRKIQRENQIALSDRLEGNRDDGYNLTIEMETGVGKTYTYIKTMYELNNAYGWSKFIVVVPSIAIREGVFKSFQMTEEHFAEEYGKKIRFFIYNSSQLNSINGFAQDNAIHVMIINSQAFNAKGKDARRIYMELDEFNSRKPIDILAKTNPVLIIDEPQSVEGPQTKERLKEFNPILTLRYSATHKSDSVYNMVYRLDAMEAYNKRLVKKISVKGISKSGTTATNSYVYLEKVNLSQKDPTATIQFEVKQVSGVKPKSRIFNIGDNLYDYSSGLEEYKNGFVVKSIDGRDNSVEFLNGIRICEGDAIGKVDEDQIRRIQIRETILSHLERERELFHKGIKVLSLFFIDEVANYRQYDAAGQPVNGKYATIFEEEYNEIVNNFQLQFGEEDYSRYLNSILASETHAGYFSVDGKGKMVNSKVGRKETTSDDVSAYELIMKNKELLLDRDPKRSPVRFIFSHSALREGWDNPNVFQICTLKQSGSDVRKRQEVGRGLRLCVNQNGERMDTNALGDDVHNINVLTVIASESYDDFAKGLQTELAEAVADRPRAVTPQLFEGKVIKDSKGNVDTITPNIAFEICYDLRKNGYIDSNGTLTDKYYDDKAKGEIKVAEKVADCVDSIIQIVDSIFDPKSIKINNARNTNVELRVDKDKLAMPEFQALWSKINAKSVYVVDFDTEELVENAVTALDGGLKISPILVTVETGSMDTIKSRDDLANGTAFVSEKTETQKMTVSANSSVKYDLVGKLVDETGLTRKTIVAILRRITPKVFDQFKLNPEEFILKAAALINDEKAAVIVQHITYNMLDEHYSTDLFTDPTIRGKLGENARKTRKHLYDHVVCDSDVEKKFASGLENSSEVAVYVKLPKGFYISTPVGKYNPDWAIAFYEGKVKHIYFVAETKGSLNSQEFRKIEDSKIECAKKHFAAISNGNVVYKVVKDYNTLLQEVMKN